MSGAWTPPVVVAGAFSPTPPGPAPAATPPDQAIASIAIPAHDESSVIGRCLDALAPLSEHLEIVVVCNGCRDDTATIARRHLLRHESHEHRVFEIDRASKPAALRLADATLTTFPRIYLDADVVVTARAITDMVAALESHDRLAVRPPVHHDLHGASYWARRHARARSRIEWFDTALWGGGVIALSAAGRQRLGPWPDVTADDLWVASGLDPDEIGIIDTDPVMVRVPRTMTGVWAIARRSHRGVRNLDVAARTTSRTTRQLIRTAPRAPLDAAVYAAVAIGTRLGSRRDRPADGARTWERDRSSR
jgi:hypothetical protein